jgi:hypothetical protein
MPTIELWLFVVTDPLTGKRRRTTYRLTIEEASERHIDAKPVQFRHHMQWSARPATACRARLPRRPVVCPLDQRRQQQLRRSRKSRGLWRPHEVAGACGDRVEAPDLGDERANLAARESPLDRVQLTRA